MALRSLTNSHSYAGSFVNPTALPNTAGAAEQNASLEAGDFAYVAPGRVFYCITPTMGAAVWSEYNSELIQGFPLHIYVSAINGSDANDGLSPGTALASLVKAETMVPNVVNSDVVIHVGRFDVDTIDEYEMPRFRRRNLRANVFLFCDGAGQPGADGAAFTELLASTVAGASTTANSITGTFVANVYQGKTLEILTGPAANFRCTIRNNTTTAIIPVNTIGASVIAGHTYRIIEPTVRIAVAEDPVLSEVVLAEGMGSPDASPTTDVLTSSFYVINAIFQRAGTTSGGVGFCLKNSSVVFFGCEQREQTILNIRLDSSGLSCGHNGADFSRSVGSYGLAILGVTNNVQWRGWGMSSLGATPMFGNPGSHSFFSGVLDGYMVFRRPVIFRDNVTVNIRGGAFSVPSLVTVAPISVYKSTAYIIGPGTGATTAVAPQILIEGPATTTAGIDVDFGAKASIANCSINIPTAPGCCIRSIRGSLCEIAAGGVPDTGLTGSCGGYALLAQLGGKIWGQQNEGSPTGIWSNFGLTGGLGYLSVDNHTNSDNGLAPGLVLLTSGDQVTNFDGSSIVRVV